MFEQNVFSGSNKCTSCKSQLFSYLNHANDSLLSCLGNSELLLGTSLFPLFLDSHTLPLMFKERLLDLNNATLKDQKVM